ncbi:hypothetical protein ACG02S_01015 [Roseateles sp. DC23W]|uniref:Uncharacterized protein n=1 Tax=Pelomonas dachongensis TaxID=3299029 RepID=A0ABW7EKB5_9BURK
MSVRKTIPDGAHSPYVAFTDDRQRKWALVSRDIRLVLIALIIAMGGGAALKWPAIWHFISGG